MAMNDTDSAHATNPVYVSTQNQCDQIKIKIELLPATEFLCSIGAFSGQGGGGGGGDKVFLQR